MEPSATLRVGKVGGEMKGGGKESGGEGFFSIIGNTHVAKDNCGEGSQVDRRDR